MYSKKKIAVKDSVHGSIELGSSKHAEEALALVVDSEEFQRLRKIKQLGGSSFVYPGATHTRFEHSIGVCFIASEVMKALVNQKEGDESVIQKLNEKLQVDFEVCVEVAALCHDLGHGPFSHLYDKAVADLKETAVGKIKQFLEKKGHSANDRKLLKRAIDGKLSDLEDEEKRALKELIKEQECSDKDQSLLKKVLDLELSKEEKQKVKQLHEGERQTDEERLLETKHSLVLRKKHEFRSVEVFKKLWAKNEELHRKICVKELKIIGKMITFSEDYKEEKKCVDQDKELSAKIEKEIQEKGYKGKKEKLYCEIAKENEILQRLGIDRDTAFLYEIVANGFTGIDVDKMDYFIRDGHGLGLSSNFDWRRFVQTLKIIRTDEDHKIQRLCSREKEAYELYELFHIRNKLYHQAYCHKTAIAIEHIIKQALTDADNDLYVLGAQGEFSILDAWQDIDAFLHLTNTIEDVIMQDLQQLPAEKQAQSGAFFWKVQTLPDGIKRARLAFQNIKMRKQMRFIGERKKEEAVTAKILERLTEKATTGQIIVEEAKFSYGMGKSNPIEQHFFYNKRKPEFAYHLPSDKVSAMLPKKFVEVKVMFYYQPNENNGECLNELEKLREEFEEVNEEIEEDKNKEQQELQQDISRLNNETQELEGEIKKQAEKEQIQELKEQKLLKLEQLTQKYERLIEINTKKE